VKQCDLELVVCSHAVQQYFIIFQHLDPDPLHQKTNRNKILKLEWVFLSLHVEKDVGLTGSGAGGVL
jgi:hypothetical protein